MYNGNALRNLRLNGYKDTGKTMKNISIRGLKKIAVELSVNYEDLLVIKDKRNCCHVYKKEGSNVTLDPIPYGF